MRILTIAKNGVPSEASLRFADEVAVVNYLHQRYGGQGGKKLAGRVWLNEHGMSRMTFVGAENLRVLPMADGHVFFVDSESTFAAINNSTASPQPVAA